MSITKSKYFYEMMAALIGFWVWCANENVYYAAASGGAVALVCLAVHESTNRICHAIQQLGQQDISK